LLNKISIKKENEMSYLTSRSENFEEFNVGDEMIRYNLWKKKMWPLRELEEGDKLNFFCTSDREIKLIGEVIEVFKSEYTSNAELREQISANGTDYDEEYITESKEEIGNILLYKVKIVDKVNTPLDIKLSMLGWERLD